MCPVYPANSGPTKTHNQCGEGTLSRGQNRDDRIEINKVRLLCGLCLDGMQAGNEILTFLLFPSSSPWNSTVFVEMAVAPHDDIAEIDHALSRIPGVLRIMAQEDSTLDDAAATEYMGGGEPLAARFCGVGGSGIMIARYWTHRTVS